MLKARQYKKLIYVILSLALSVGVLGYLLRRVNLADVLQLFMEADRNALLMFVVLSLAATSVRTWKYHILLAVSGCAPNPASLFFVVLARNLASDLLPARIGSAIYIYLINARLGVPLAPALSSFVLSFLFEVIALVPLILLALMFAVQIPRLPLALAAGAIAAGMTALLIILPGLCRRAAQRFKVGVIERTAEELTKTRAAGIYGRLLVLSLTVRVLKYASLYLFLYALLKPQGYSLEMLSPALVFLGICSAEVAASLPFSGIAGFGAYEGTWAAVFTLFGFPRAIAELTALSHHLFTQIYGYSIGAAALLLLLLPIWRTGCVPAARTPSIMAFVRSLCLFVMLTAGALSLAAAAPIRAAPPPRDNAAAGDPRLGKRLAEFLSPNAWIVFDSNRSGNFGIYALDRNGVVRVLIDSARHEIYPDPSPDGNWLTYAVSPSLLRNAPSEIWISRSDGSGARRVADNGTFPTFSSDGSKIFFERGRKQVMEVNVDGSSLRKLYPTKTQEFRGYEIVKPRVSPDGRYLAFISDRGGAWNSWHVDLAENRAEHIGEGCEPAWYPDSSSVAWVRGPGTKAKSGIYTFDRRSRTVVETQDADDPLGHEYFPTVSRDGGLLLYASCGQDEHSHTDANYQLHIKHLSAGTTARLTFDGFTNRWPKIVTTAKID